MYSSEIRAKFISSFRFGTLEYIDNLEKEVSKSRKTMIEYFQILHQNDLLFDEVNANPDCIQKPWYNLFSSRLQMFPNTYNVNYP